VLRLCQEFGIQTTLGELLRLPSTTFQMLAVVIVSLKEKREVEAQAQRSHRELLQKTGKLAR
jgi:hypothetical protein